MEREKLSSRLGFILLSAGCAIGIGNVWKFPFLAGQNGGGLFVLIYLVFLVVLGVPVMTMEFAMGRAAQKSPVRMYRALTPEKKVWHPHGIACLVGCVMLMMFYTTVAGWMLLYFFKTALGQFEGAAADQVAGMFTRMQADPWQQAAAVAIVVALGFIVCGRGLQSGLEKVTKVIMIALLLIIGILAVNSAFLEGAKEGFRFYLLPDAGKIEKNGILKVIVAAMSQAFFTLSLGIGAMAIFGSYIGKERSLMGESVRVALLDTVVALVSGLIIFPACFAYGVDPDAGPGLIFITLPNIFNHMPLGKIWGSLFFAFMSFAAFSTVLAVFENILACVMDLTGWCRKKAALICGVGMLILSLPCLLGFNLLSSVETIGPGKNLMDLEDFIVSNILLPLGSLVFVLFCTLRRGWGWKAFVDEANQGNGFKVARWMRWPLTILLPAIILAVFIIGLIP